MFVKKRFLREYSLWSKYKKSERGVWDENKYSFLTQGLCFDFIKNKLNEQTMAYELFHIYYVESGLVSYKPIITFIDDLTIILKSKYEVEVDLHNQVTFIASEAVS